MKIMDFRKNALYLWKGGLYFEVSLEALIVGPFVSYIVLSPYVENVQYINEYFFS